MNTTDICTMALVISCTILFIDILKWLLNDEERSLLQLEIKKLRKQLNDQELFHHEFVKENNLRSKDLHDEIIKLKMTSKNGQKAAIN